VASANVDNVTIVEPKTDAVLGTLPARNVRKTLQWLKEPGRTVVVEFRHGTATPIRRSIDLSQDSVLPHVEFAADAAAPAVVTVETVRLRVRSNISDVLIALSDREAAYPLGQNSRSKVIQVDKGDKPISVTVTRAGYLPSTATFIPNADGEISVDMRVDPNANMPAAKVGISLRVNVPAVDVVLPNGLKYVTPKKRGDALLLQLDQQEAPLTLSLSKRGYEDNVLEVVPNADKTITARLLRRKRPDRKPAVPGAANVPTTGKPSSPQNPRLSPIKTPKKTGPGRLGRLKGF